VSSRKVVFLGNCLGRVIHNFYVDNVAPLTGDDVSYVASFAIPDDTIKRQLGEADILVNQMFDVERSAGVHNVDTQAKIIWFPNITGMFLWPFGGTAHPLNKPEAYLPHGPYDVNLGDRWLNRKIRQGPATAQEARQIAAEYMEMDLAAVAKADRYYELTMGQQKQRDQKTGFDCGNLIERHMHDTVLFPNPAMLTMPLFRHVIDELFARLDAPRDTVSRALDRLVNPPFAGIERPIHPSVAKMFDLRFVTPLTRYRAHTYEKLDLREFVARYCMYDWNAPLLDAIHRAGRTGRDSSPEDVAGAIADLTVALRGSAGSAQAELALARMHDLRSDTVQALASYSLFLLLEPDDGHATGHVAGVLADSGRLGTAIQLLTTATLRWPQLPDHWRRLAGLLQRTGRDEEAYETLERALAVHADDRHVREYHDSLGSMIASRQLRAAGA